MGALKRALNLYRADPKAWKALQRRGMDQDFSWDKPAAKYMELFNRMLQ
jgi:starch synthase